MPDVSASTKPSAYEFLQIFRKQQQGKLKIYLGASPGVGKTYQMLVEGNRLLSRGVDVVIGYVEPHERPDTTAQIKDLEVIPPRVSEYHGIKLSEMDLLLGDDARSVTLQHSPQLIAVNDVFIREAGHLGGAAVTINLAFANNGTGHPNLEQCSIKDIINGRMPGLNPTFVP